MQSYQAKRAPLQQGIENQQPQNTAVQQFAKGPGHSVKKIQLKLANNYLNMNSVNQLLTKTPLVQRVIDTSTNGMATATGGMPNHAFSGLPHANKTVKKYKIQLPLLILQA
jgi:hypothetical protein